MKTMFTHNLRWITFFQFGSCGIKLTGILTRKKSEVNFDCCFGANVLIVK